MVLSLNPTDVVSLYNLGLIKSRSGNYEEALKLYEKSFRLGFKNLALYNKKGMNKRNFDSALSYQIGYVKERISGYPFKLRPDSFENYLNSLSWEDGIRRRFSGLRVCEAKGPRLGDAKFIYGCKYAYVSINDPIRGNIFCQVSVPTGYGSSLNYAVRYDEIEIETGDIGPCRRR